MTSLNQIFTITMVLYVVIVSMTTFCEARSVLRPNPRSKKNFQETLEFCRELQHRVSFQTFRDTCAHLLDRTTTREVRQESREIESYPAAIRQAETVIGPMKDKYGFLNRLAHLLRKEYLSERVNTDDYDATMGERENDETDQQVENSPMYLIRKWSNAFPRVR